DTAWQARWANGKLTVFVTVDDATVDGGDQVELVVNGNLYYAYRTGGANVPYIVDDAGDSWDVVVELPLPGAQLGDTVEFDVRAVDDGVGIGWNTHGEY